MAADEDVTMSPDSGLEDACSTADVEPGDGQASVEGDDPRGNVCSSTSLPEEGGRSASSSEREEMGPSGATAESSESETTTASAESTAADEPARDASDVASAAGEPHEVPTGDHTCEDGGHVTDSPADSGAAASESVDADSAPECREGAQSDEVGEERPKGTDEVAGSSGGDGDLHGGDGNSGELSAPAETRAKGERMRVPLRSFGGDTAGDWLSIRKRMDLRAAREVERALRRLIRTFDVGGDETSPRVDGSRLVREITSLRVSLGRARRSELDLPLILLCCDVSGSCSAVCEETLAAALSVAEAQQNAVVIRHSNGIVIDVLGQAATKPCSDDERIVGLVATLQQPIGAVIAWGDWDAGHDYQFLAEQGADLYWLDSYCASWGARPASSHLRAGAMDWRRQPVGWWQGVNDATSTAIALRSMARKAR